MQNLLTLKYWFDLRPEPLILAAQKVFIFAITIFIILTVAIAFLKNKNSLYKGILKKLYAFCLANSLIGLILFFLNYEMIPFLSARAWLGLWIIITLAWLFFILKKLKTIPETKKQLAKEQELKKYIP